MSEFQLEELLDERDQEIIELKSQLAAMREVAAKLCERLRRYDYCGFDFDSKEHHDLELVLESSDAGRDWEARVRADEREQCARIATKCAAQWGKENILAGRDAAAIAELIRAGGNK